LELRVPLGRKGSFQFLHPRNFRKVLPIPIFNQGLGLEFFLFLPFKRFYQTLTFFFIKGLRKEDFPENPLRVEGNLFLEDLTGKVPPREDFHGISLRN